MKSPHVPIRYTACESMGHTKYCLYNRRVFIHEVATLRASIFCSRAESAPAQLSAHVNRSAPTEHNQQNEVELVIEKGDLMNQDKRNELIEEYGRGFDLIMAALAEIPPEAWAFKPAPGPMECYSDSCTHEGQRNKRCFTAT